MSESVSMARKVQIIVKELDYGPFLDIDIIAPLDGFGSQELESPFHPFWRAYATERAPWKDDDGVDADEMAQVSFNIENTTVSLGQVVADNGVTRAILDAIRNIDTLEVGNADRSDYLANLIEILMLRLWD